MSHCVMSVKELQCLNLRWRGSLELCITTVDEIKTPGDQCLTVDSVSILNEIEQNILYHVSICFDSCGGSATKNKEQVHSFLVIKDCISTVDPLSEVIF